MSCGNYEKLAFTLWVTTADHGFHTQGVMYTSQLPCGGITQLEG